MGNDRSFPPIEVCENDAGTLRSFPPIFVGYFLKLVNKHFNNKHKFKKIFNKNTLKISYSCMPSLQTIINSHNRKVLSSAETRNEETCNCKVKENCPLQGNCLTANNLYKATLSSSIPGYGTKIYLGHVCFNHSLNANLVLPRFAHALIL